MAGYGLRPVKGPGTGYGTNTGGFNEYPVADDYAGNIFSGDFVELIANGTVQRQNTTAGESPVAAKPTLGVAVGFRWVDANKSPHWGQYYPGGTATEIYAFVTDNPGQIYMIQADAAAAQLTVGETYLVQNFVHTDGSTSTGNSGITLDIGSAGTGAQTCKILSIPKDGKNENSSTPDVIIQLLPGVSQLNLNAGI